MAKEIKDPLDILKAIPLLEVGPVRLEAKRLIAPYKITDKNETDSFDLVYKFEEQVFTPDDPGSVNLAGIIAAQAAVNYGLFCEKIIFHGLYDRHDIDFIKKVSENTAREIYVNKLLEHNPFITGPVSQLPVIKKKSYLNAELVFNTYKKDAGLKDIKSENAINRKCAILSSGGKESLLSYGLMNETGFDTHPVFINESGRHWFTALNSYRYFNFKIPETARVWTNADRIYNRMLKHLPFIRKDFSRLRSDEYPIRLWTVAVFLFGALPILKKRGISHLIIGDEYDTTVKENYKGISHYAGLFDQSVFFDKLITGYFKKKSWGINVFSILRPFSELLILKLLSERYPELQEHQVSCHATHMEGERVKPCGRCEKCRRIVAMLSALEKDPSRCGYTRDNIKYCLDHLSGDSLHQEKHAVEQLCFMLHKRGLTGSGDIRPVEHQEIMGLRFDDEKSPVDCIPEGLRAPLFKFLKKDINMAFKKERKSWRPCELPDGKKESENSSTGNTGDKKTGNYLLGELTWPEAKKKFSEVDVALFPVGAIEQHGPHLPLDADAYDAEYLAIKVAEACKNPKPIVMPLIPYGVSYHHEDFSGTISISPETLSSIVYEAGMSIAKHGIKKLVIINGHGGNSPALHFAAQMINRDSHIFTCVDTGETSDPDINEMTETPNDVHAGEIETSTTLATRPHLVKSDKMKRFIPRFSNRYLDFTSKRSIGWYAMTSKISRSGVMGDPLKGNRIKGERMWEIMIKNLVEFVEDLKTMTPDEIYQKRY
ncbi:MAG: creatininase family protein [Desulfobacteraceae bacterium]|jgi:creatinine amidohydrolase/Fe(II)-dependent formamide hydrolase-like protein